MVCAIYPPETQQVILTGSDRGAHVPYWPRPSPVASVESPGRPLHSAVGLS